MRKQIRVSIFLGLILILLSCVHKPPQPYKSFEEAAQKLNTPILIDKYERTIA